VRGRARYTASGPPERPARGTVIHEPADLVFAYLSLVSSLCSNKARDSAGCRPGPLDARRIVQRGAAAAGVPDGWDRKCPSAGHHAISGCAVVLRPGCWPAARVLVFRGRTLLPPGRPARSRLRDG